MLDLQDMSAYLSLIDEVRKSVSSGKIQLKDSDKMIHYLELIVRSIPEFQERSKRITAELNSLRSKDKSAFDRFKEIHQKVSDVMERMSRSQSSMDQLTRQNEERKSELTKLLDEASELLLSVSGKRYSIQF
jgi:septal ring factor EnvC (AmiA/AmiB activator)